MKLKQILPFSLLILTALSSCKKDELITDSSAKLGFSTDSILFDTVFQYAGSTTKIFKIYNPHDQPINISKAYLAGGSGSAFKLNIDGISTTSTMPVLTDIEIFGGDSMYVFVQVYVNPSGSLPVVIKDSIIFETNGNIQDVKLIAIGQDVYLHTPNVFPTNGFPPYSIIGTEGIDATLPNDKPHLFFGYAIIDSDCILTIQAGTKCYFNNYAVLMVFEGGTLNVNGTLGNEVIFQGARLESEYNDVPGQWGKIWLSRLSKNNSINYAIIKNGGIGIQVDTVASTTIPTLRLSNTIIKNMSAAALFGQGAHIRAVNCVFANCGQYVAALTIGGKYRFEHCTFANYWTYDSRVTPTLVMGNHYYADGIGEIVRPLDSCYFGNCIIYGDIAEEVGMDSALTSGVFSYKFDYSDVRTTRTPDGHYVSPMNNDPGFADVTINNYRIGSPSAFAADKGLTTIATSIPLDIRGMPRPNTFYSTFSDLGAYEYYP